MKRQVIGAILLGVCMLVGMPAAQGGPAGLPQQFVVIPAVGPNQVLLRWHQPPAGNAYVVYRDNVAVASVTPLTDPAAVQNMLGPDWPIVSDLLAQYFERGPIGPGDFLPLLNQSPLLKALLPEQYYRVALVLGLGFLDVGVAPGPHTYTVRRLVNGQEQELGPYATVVVQAGQVTSVVAPLLTDVTSAVADQLGVVADRKIFLTWEMPPPPQTEPPPPEYVAFGFDLERGPTPNGPWQQLNLHPILPATPVALPAQKPAHVPLTDEEWQEVLLSPVAQKYQPANFRYVDGEPGEDLNGNGLLDPGEDANGNGQLDPPPLKYDQTYYYRVRGRDALGQPGQWSQPLAASPLDTRPPGAPLEVQAEKVPGQNQIHLTWQRRPEDAEVTNFEVWRREGKPQGFPNPPWQMIKLIPAQPGQNEYEWVDKQGLLPGQTYWYRLRARDDAQPQPNRSLPSAPAYAVLYDEEAPGVSQFKALGRPRKEGEGGYPCVSISPLLPGQGQYDGVHLQWQAPPDAVGFRIYRGFAPQPCTGPPPVWYQIDEIRPTPPYTYVDHFQPADTTETWYAIRAFDAEYNLSDYTVLSQPVLVPGSQPPPRPYIQAATAELVGNTWQVTLKWEVPLPQQSVAGFEVYRAESEDTVPGQKISGPQPLSFQVKKYVDTAVEFRQDYWYSVGAVNPATGQREMSSPQHVKVTAPPEEPLKGLKQFALTQAQPNPNLPGVNLAWQPLVMGEGQKIRYITYVVFRSEIAADRGFRQVSEELTATTYTDKDVRLGATYHYFVLAFEGVSHEIIGYSTPVLKAVLAAPVLIPVPVTKVLLGRFALPEGGQQAFPFTPTANRRYLFRVEWTGNAPELILTVRKLRFRAMPLAIAFKRGSAPLTLSVTFTAATLQGAQGWEVNVAAPGGAAQGTISYTSSPLLTIITPIVPVVPGP
ncbi:MAG TPA: hypothetical protein EYP85_11910 [Armatimonadetes bacterium]|nr:hypothetical protein [Armatimonadota bacterium]